MPLYEYRCDKCQKTFEVIQRFSEAPLSECPDCKGAVSKLLSKSAFHLKGSGWYASDYKKPSSTGDSSGGGTSSGSED